MMMKWFDIVAATLLTVIALVIRLSFYSGYNPEEATFDLLFIGVLGVAALFIRNKIGDNDE